MYAKTWRSCVRVHPVPSHTLPRADRRTDGRTRQTTRRAASVSFLVIAMPASESRLIAANRFQEYSPATGYTYTDADQRGRSRNAHTDAGRDAGSTRARVVSKALRPSVSVAVSTERASLQRSYPSPFATRRRRCPSPLAGRSTSIFIFGLHRCRCFSSFFLRVPVSFRRRCLFLFRSHSAAYSRTRSALSFIFSYIRPTAAHFSIFISLLLLRFRHTEDVRPSARRSFSSASLLCPPFGAPLT